MCCPKCAVATTLVHCTPPNPAASGLTSGRVRAGVAAKAASCGAHSAVRVRCIPGRGDGAWIACCAADSTAPKGACITFRRGASVHPASGGPFSGHPVCYAELQGRVIATDMPAQPTGPAQPLICPRGPCPRKHPLHLLPIAATCCYCWQLLTGRAQCTGLHITANQDAVSAVGARLCDAQCSRAIAAERGGTEWGEVDAG